MYVCTCIYTCIYIYTCICTFYIYMYARICFNVYIYICKYTPNRQTSGFWALTRHEPSTCELEMVSKQGCQRPKPVVPWVVQILDDFRCQDPRNCGSRVCIYLKTSLYIYICMYIQTHLCCYIYIHLRMCICTCEVMLYVIHCSAWQCPALRGSKARDGGPLKRSHSAPYGVVYSMVEYDMSVVVSVIWHGIV